mmetsp:Transcript_3768/g.8034  ORF Transcript_3768/g.8034 Transcript_3768/m.8034 type:complete len:176 (-) Transcript_3768:105-632(-)
MEKLPSRLDVFVIEASVKEIRQALDEEYEWLLEESTAVQEQMLDSISQPVDAKRLKQLSRKLEHAYLEDMPTALRYKTPKVNRGVTQSLAKLDTTEEDEFMELLDLAGPKSQTTDNRPFTTEDKNFRIRSIKRPTTAAKLTKPVLHLRTSSTNGSNSKVARQLRNVVKQHREIPL